MKRFRKIYLETSNVCNLRCAFCPGTKREKRRMSLDEFRFYADCVKGYADYLYFHLMGEPLLQQGAVGGEDHLESGFSSQFQKPGEQGMEQRLAHEVKV